MSKLLRFVLSVFLLVSCLALLAGAKANSFPEPPSSKFVSATAITLYADSVGGMPDTEVVVPIRVKNFTNMITGQGTISFDPAVVTFVGVEQFGLPGMGNANFGTTQTDRGKLLFSWDDATLDGQSLADEAILFAVRFQVSGNYGENSAISFTDDPVVLEFIDNTYTAAVLTLQAGKVQVPAYSIATTAFGSNIFCTGNSLDVIFTAEGTYDAGNVFTAQLSDENGSFATPTTIGSGSSSPVASILPAATTQGTGYRIRVVASSPAITGTDNGSDLAINPTPAAPSVQGASRCGTGVLDLTASGAVTGESYRWYTEASGGTAIGGATAATYTTPELSTTTTYYVSVISSAGCESDRTAVVATVSETPSAPSVTEGSSCGAGMVDLVAAGAPEGGSYRWYTEASGGTAISGATAATYTTPELSTTTTYYVSVISSADCESSRTEATATIKEVPAAPVAGASSTQVGGTLYLSASTVAGATYSWTGPNGFISTAQYPSVTGATTDHSGTYSVVAVIDGCSSVAGTVEVAIVDVPPVTFDPDSVSGLVGSEVLVPVTVKGFTDIVSMQYSLNWDPSVATFVGVEEFGLAGLTASNFGTSQAAEGNLMLSWIDANLEAHVLADDAVLFKLRLRLTGSKGQYTPVFVTGTPTAIEVTESNGFIVPVNAMTGAATILTEVKISGKIKSEQGEGIPTATVTSNGSESPVMFETGADGLYEFDVMQGGTYSISPFKNNDAEAFNGITTLDIALIRRHILNITALGTPYKLLAADADNSGSITTTDIASVRKVILTIDNFFPVNRLWAFVPENFTFSDPTNPFPFEDSVQVHADVVEALSNQDFIGVKVGDVSNSWDSSNARMGAVGELVVQLSDQQVAPGSELTVPVKVYDFQSVSAYQFTLSWDPQVLEFQSVESATAKGAFGTHKVGEGNLTTSWDDREGRSQSLPEGSVIFYVKFKAVGGLDTETELSISSDLTRSLAYNHKLEQLNIVAGNARVQLSNNASPVFNGYALYQNTPNPFIPGDTRIRFSIPQEEEVSIRIYNSVGQLIRVYTNNYAAGDHGISWDGRNTSGHQVTTGTYFYQMKAGGFTDARRALVVRQF